MNTAWRIAVIGAGPVGLALALHAARLMPHASITLFDARPADTDVSRDPRTLALSLGSVMFLQRLGVWDAGGAGMGACAAAEPITTVHVSQATPSLLGDRLGAGAVELHAAALGVPQLGAVLAYGALLAPLQAAWLADAAAAPDRLTTLLGTRVEAVDALADGVDVRSEGGGAQRFDLAVVAEGGVFAEQAHKTLRHDYAQTAWVGSVVLRGAARGAAFERFTRHGPAALLPLPRLADGAHRAALVWCVPQADDPVRTLDAAQRCAVLGTVFPAAAGRIESISELKAFPLGLNAERTLVHRRTVRVGNAAQTLHPVAGQGLNLGLRDAHTLVAALRWAEDLDVALKRIEWARAPDRWSTIATTDFLARSFTWQVPGAASARLLGLAAVQATPPLKRWLARQMMFGWR